MLTVVAYTTAPWEHALAQLRIVGPLRLAGFNVVRGGQNGNYDPESVSAADLVLIYRDFPRHQQEYERIRSLARAQSKPIVFDLDDLLLGLPPDHPDRLSHYYAGALFPMLRCILEADGITAVSATLADILRPINPNVWVLHNYLDDDIWDLTSVPEEVDDGVVTMGYWGGDSHAPDFDLVIPVLKELLLSYKDRLAFKLVGLTPFSELRDLPNVEWIPFRHTYSEYVSFIREQKFDLVVAPMRDIPFNRSKGSLKFQEASAIGLPGVYSDTLPFQEQVIHGKNGFLVTTQDEWKNALVKLIEDRSLRRQVGQAALHTLRQDWVLSKNAYKWKDAYQEILSRPRPYVPVGGIPVDLFMDLSQQTQSWQVRLHEELHQATHQVEELHAGLAEKEQYITSLTAQIAVYRNSTPVRLLRAFRRAFSLLNPARIIDRRRSD